MELGQVSATETLRPPGAVPPPPRQVPSAGRTAIRPNKSVELTGSPEEISPDTTRTPQPPSGAESIPRTDPRFGASFDPHIPGSPRAPDTLPPMLDRPTSVPPQPDVALHEPSRVESKFSLSRRRVPAMIVAGVGTALLLFGWYLTRSSSEPGAAATERASTEADDAQRPPLPCRLVGEPRKLADAVYLGVPLTPANAPEDRIALAFAANGTDAIGLTLDPLTLDAARAFSEAGQNQLVAVLPHGQAALQFATARTEVGVRGGGVVELPTGLARLKMSDDGLKVQLGAQTHTAWPELSDSNSTSPRAEPLGDKGAIVTVRRGGMKGDILVGMLDEQGRPRGALAKIASAAREFGTPSVSVGREEVLLSFSSRMNSDAPWRIELARAPIGQLPAASRPFVPEGLKDTAQAISPAAAPLPGGGWLLQWTVGDEGKHQVWVQALDDVLNPIGNPLRVGPADADCGQGAPWVGNQHHAASFYIARTAQQSELWGTTLECPR